MNNPIYVLLETSHIQDNQSTILSMYFTDRAQALAHAKTEIQALPATNTYQGTISPVETHWEGEYGEPQSEVIGYSICDADGMPLDSITIHHVLHYQH